MNNVYKIKITSPLIRPGIEITTEVSENYVEKALGKILEIIRDFNLDQDLTNVDGFEPPDDCVVCIHTNDGGPCCEPVNNAPCQENSRPWDYRDSIRRGFCPECHRGPIDKMEEKWECPLCGHSGIEYGISYTGPLTPKPLDEDKIKQIMEEIKTTMTAEAAKEWSERASKELKPLNDMLDSMRRIDPRRMEEPFTK